MEENSIYSSWQEGESGETLGQPHPYPSSGVWELMKCPCFPSTVTEFPVIVQRTEATARCQLKGPYLLVLGQDDIQLRETSKPQACFSWPYRFLRKYGSDKVRCWAT